MKPAWDKLGSEYKGSASVVIGDVDCTVEQELCQQHGVRGYPTIKYYTDETGEEGESYSGGRDFDTLKAFVEENLGGPSCDIEDIEECTEKEQAFFEKMKSKGSEYFQKQIARLNKMSAKKMKAELKDWLTKRLNIFKQLLASAPKHEEL